MQDLTVFQSSFELTGYITAMLAGARQETGLGFKAPSS